MALGGAARHRSRPERLRRRGRRRPFGHHRSGLDPRDLLAGLRLSGAVRFPALRPRSVHRAALCRCARDGHGSEQLAALLDARAVLLVRAGAGYRSRALRHGRLLRSHEDHRDRCQRRAQGPFPFHVSDLAVASDGGRPVRRLRRPMGDRAGDTAGIDIINAGLSPCSVGETHRYTVLDPGSSTARTFCSNSTPSTPSPTR